MLYTHGMAVEDETPMPTQEEINKLTHLVNKVNADVLIDIIYGCFSKAQLSSLNLDLKVEHVPHYQHRTEGMTQLKLSFTSDKVDEYGKCHSTSSQEREFASKVRQSRNIKPSWYNRSFNINTRSGVDMYRIVDYNMRAQTYPVVCKVITSKGRVKTMKCSEQFILNSLLQA